MENFPVSSYRYLYCVTFFNLYGGKNVEITFPLPREKAEKKMFDNGNVFFYQSFS